MYFHKNICVFRILACNVASTVETCDTSSVLHSCHCSAVPQGDCDVHSPCSIESTFWLNSAVCFLLRRARAGSFPIIAACKTGRGMVGVPRALWRFSVTTHNWISWPVRSWLAGLPLQQCKRWWSAMSEAGWWFIFGLVYYTLPVTHSIFGKGS